MEAQIISCSRAAGFKCGIILMMPALIALTNINFAIIEIPGPILGVIFGLVVIGLGVAKGIMAARTVAARIES